MTDGIIQKVFNGSKSMLDRNCKQFTYRDTIMHFELCEKRLIEEIKKEFPTDEIPEKNSEVNMIPIGNVNIEVSKVLIGDNQE